MLSGECQYTGVNFANPDPPITEDEIRQCEFDCGIRLPPPLRSTYVASNGGEPDSYVFENDELDTVVSEFLPLRSESRETAVQTYQILVMERAIVSRNFFPFAVDGCGDYFFVDTETPDGRVFFFRSDSVAPSLVFLGMGLNEFWASLKPE